MAEQVLNTLNEKRLEIESHIGSLEQDLEQARRDLSAILAAIKVFSGEGYRVTAYMNLSRLFPRHELPKMARAALAGSPEGISTVGIAAYVLSEKGMDGGDRHLRKSIAYKVVQVLRRWERQGTVKRLGKDRGAVVWELSREAGSSGLS
jgi:hypothetical protein